MSGNQTKISCLNTKLLQYSIIHCIGFNLKNYFNPFKLQQMSEIWTSESRTFLEFGCEAVTNFSKPLNAFHARKFLFFAGVGVNVGGQGEHPSTSGLSTRSAMISTEHEGQAGGHYSEVGPSGQVNTKA